MSYRGLCSGGEGGNFGSQGPTVEVWNLPKQGDTPEAYVCWLYVVSMSLLPLAFLDVVH